MREGRGLGDMDNEGGSGFRYGMKGHLKSIGVCGTGRWPCDMDVLLQYNVTLVHFCSTMRRGCTSAVQCDLDVPLRYAVQCSLGE